MKISVLIPTYHGTPYIKASLDSVLQQNYKDIEVIICNDSLDDHKDMKQIVDLYNDPRLKFIPNEKNLGYPLNMRKAFSLGTGDIFFLMAQDDVILQNDHFNSILNIFKDPDVGCVTRPYYWFEDDVTQPIRYIPKHNKRKISYESNAEDINQLIETLGQFSGLVLRSSFITQPVNANVFTAHIYPFLSVMRTHKAYFAEDFTVAVRTSSSQTRFLSSIYNPSPTETWVKMFNEVFPEEKYKSIRTIGIDHMTQHFVGLVQIKNYGYYKDLIADIGSFIKYRKANIFSVRFWFFVFCCLIIPRFILRYGVDFYKNVISKDSLKNLLKHD
jgi:glycosyltransferase involved in cell wall biosynthesis